MTWMNSRVRPPLAHREQADIHGTGQQAQAHEAHRQGEVAQGRVRGTGRDQQQQGHGRHGDHRQHQQAPFPAA